MDGILVSHTYLVVYNNSGSLPIGSDSVRPFENPEAKVLRASWDLRHILRHCFAVRSCLAGKAYFMTTERSEHQEGQTHGVPRVLALKLIPDGHTVASYTV